MATKKQNRRYLVRRNRRVLNRTNDGPMKVSSHRLNRICWGRGLNNRSFTGPDTNGEAP